MPTLDLRDGRLYLEVGPLEHDMARLVPGLNWNHHKNEWWGLPSWATALACRGVFGDSLTLTEATREWGAEKVRWEEWSEALRTWKSDAPWTQGLRPLQTTGVGWLLAKQRAGIFDDAGSGKGVMVAVALDLLPDDAFPALIVCPRTVKWTHARHLEDWTEGRAVPYVVSGNATQRRKLIEAGLADPRGVLIMNWESLRYHSKLAPYGSIKRTEKESTPSDLNDKGIATVIVDEAHRAKDPKSKQTRALRAITDGALRVWLTTATPVPDPLGFWSLMNIMAPYDFTSRVKAQDRYMLTESTFVSGGRKVEKVKAFNPRTEAELRRITAPYMLRRSIDEIEPDLPPVVPSVLWVEMTGKQESAYKAMKKDMLAKVPSGIIAATDPMQQSLRLLQMASALPTFDDENRLVSFEEPSCKLDALCEWLDDHDPSLSLVVFAVSRRLIELCAAKLEKRGDTFGLITGAQNEGARAIAESEFQAGNLRVLLGTYGAMSEGITLTRAHHQLMLQRSFKLIENVQADGRCRRIGQESDHVNIIDVVAVNSYDESVFRSGAYKEEVAQQVLNDPDWIKRELRR